MSNNTFFVTTVTGVQGGAVARHLLKQNATVHAITRTVDSPAAQELQSLGVKLFSGNLDNKEALKAGMQGCTGLFLNLPHDPTVAVTYAQTILAVAKDAGIKHVVYSTALGVNAPEKFAAWDPNGMIAMVMLPKQTIEKLLTDYGFESWTIVRPGNFMANFTKPKILLTYPGLETTGVFRTSFEKTNVIPMVDHDDIGKFGAAALLDPTRFNKQAIEIASELMTVDQIMADLSKATGKKISAHYLSDKELESEAAQGSPASWHVFLRDLAQFVDENKLKSWGIPLNSFSDFLAREKEAVIETYSQAP
ncbi:putative NAD dependent epimerase/dehydratase [Talaromyces proteolyticus]|uniref:NAD dependent epimerase/dehydratase n=1 Tax=Talaromyces proteolyticus TaxID=1131652 RepID=A0AAD4Q1P8_9EURO|nr:putative NAD dependent epimerase/dehydratase [Talaromyces proteolyticus]KAH8705880.1 putative NAD dependent epimerase/dehydratase [Talaromyces proteolyticus]